MIPYEIHLTVSLPADVPNEVDRFRKICKDFGGKGIVIEAEPLVDVMSSYRLMTSSQDLAFREMTREIMILAGHGFEVIRSKVETSLDHPWAATPLPNQYFESHLQMLCTDDQVENLRELSKSLDFHVSRNAFKTMQDDKHVRMATLRQYHTTPGAFRRRTEALYRVLGREGFEFHKEMEIEFALYDSNQKHDTPWIEANRVR